MTIVVIVIGIRTMSRIRTQPCLIFERPDVSAKRKSAGLAPFPHPTTALAWFWLNNILVQTHDAQFRPYDGLSDVDVNS
ncbi:unnamed protein product [Periconia digitata]|uniref:Uncharacterized protein n=1 Tax=Periconia digitata TaxID=1303443 RepID=A0A9W4URX1_9PLEO|nr:unnamed protein product [Periconia digitata]